MRRRLRASCVLLAYLLFFLLLFFFLLSYPYSRRYLTYMHITMFLVIVGRIHSSIERAMWTRVGERSR